MSIDRAKILAEALKVKRSEVLWHFTADYYDGPISGLAYYRNKLYRFCCFPEDVPEQHVYVLHELTPEELAEALRVKAKFETLVGTHWSFDTDGYPLPHVVRDESSWRRFYDEEGIDRRRAEPTDRPVIAWFDIAEESGTQCAN